MIKNNKGVTLVELLIVIVILGIIAAISIPAVGGIVTNAQKDAVIADAVNIRNQANLWCTSATQTQRSNYCDNESLTNWVLTQDDLEDLLSGLDGAEYAAWNDEGTWEIIINNDEYGFRGDPLNSDRSNVTGNYTIPATSVTDSSEYFD